MRKNESHLFIPLVGVRMNSDDPLEVKLDQEKHERRNELQARL